MPRGRVHAALRDALIALQARNPYWTAYRVHAEICDNSTKYDASETFSPTVVANAFAGKPLTKRSCDILSSFVRTQDATLLPLEMPKVDIDLASFLYTRGTKLDKAGEAIHGHYQTYAVSTTVEGFVRRGRISFHYDRKKWRLHVSECQVRPQIGSHPDHAMQWEGFATQRTDVYYALLRTLTDELDATPMFYAMRPLLRDTSTGRIKSLSAIAMHFEPERNYFAFPTIYLRRVEHEDEIRQDFVAQAEITDAELRKAIGLAPLKPLRRARRKQLARTDSLAADV